MSETFQKVAYIGLRNNDGSYLISVPLYIKVSDVDSKCLTQSLEDIIHRISEIMMNRYNEQISQKIINLKKGVNSNEKIQSRM